MRESFYAIYIDAIDEPNRKGKECIFGEILTAYGIAPSEALVIGDSPDSEIQAGNRLGIPTVQILRDGVTRADTATHHIRNLSDLAPLLARLLSD